MNKIWIIIAISIGCALTGACSSGGHVHSPYAGEEKRAVKALSDEDIQKYLDGDGMGFAKAAELNGFPGPKHVLEESSKLNLTPEQRTRVEESFQRMRAEAQDLGRQIVDKEKVLEALFADNQISNEKLRENTADIAALQGNLRNVHLAAHLEMKNLLSPEQIEEYRKARGYAD